MGYQYNPTGGDWQHIDQCLIGNDSRHRLRRGRSEPGTRAVGSSVMKEFTGGLISHIYLRNSFVEDLMSMTILADGIVSETADDGRCKLT